MPLILDGTTGISGVDGTAGTPAAQGTDSNTGVFYATDIVGISTGGTERMRIASGGNVGIGTSSPSYKLDVVSSAVDWAARIQNTNGNNGLIVSTTSTSSSVINFGCYNGAEYLFVVKDNGNVGIGTTSPTSKVDIIGSVELYQNANSVIYSRLANDSTGASGDSQFYVQNSANTLFFGLPSTGYTTSGLRVANTAYLYFDGANGINIGSTNASGLLKFYTGGTTERMRIDSSGNVLVGTTSSGGATSNAVPIVAGAFRTQSGVNSIASTGVATTVMTFNNNDGDFIVSMRGSGTGAPTTDDAVAVICVNGGSASQTNLKTGANVVISLSGLNLQVTQNLFGGANINWSVMRISR